MKSVSTCLALTISLFCLPVLAAASAQTPAAHKPPAQRVPATPEGRWSGSLQAGEAVLHLVLHISKSEDGSFKATIDSLDQGVYGIEVTSLSQKESTLHFNVASVSASYDGKFSVDHRTIEGDWTQGSASLPLVFHRQSAGTGARKPSNAVAAAEGIWQGALEGNGMRLRLQLHVSHDDQRQLVAALDSPDQGLSGLPAIKVSQKDAAFHFEIPVVSGVYDGTLNAAKTAITGSWTQSSVEQKLVFQRSDQLLELIRPQNPIKPYPYKEEEIAFSNEKAKISLAGTLTLPPGRGPFPAAILISDSGPHDRDESLVGHRPFLVLADHLTRKGIAVLRFDKRGNGKSTGVYASATTEDFAGDAEAALAYLKGRKEIDEKKIGLIGHSEGGIIAPMVATRSPAVAWIVLLAGPGLKGEDVLLLQSELILRTAGVNDGEVARTLAFNKQTYALVRQEKDPAALEAKLNDLVESTSTGASLALRDGGNTDFQAIELPGLNHLFQHGPTGLPTEYGGIEETMAPEALKAVSDWVLKHAAN